MRPKRSEGAERAWPERRKRAKKSPPGVSPPLAVVRGGLVAQAFVRPAAVVIVQSRGGESARLLQAPALSQMEE